MAAAGAGMLQAQTACLREACRQRSSYSRGLSQSKQGCTCSLLAVPANVQA